MKRPLACLALFFLGAPARAAPPQITLPDETFLRCVEGSQLLRICSHPSGPAPSVKRTEAIIELMYSAFPTAKRPRVAVYVLPYRVFESRYNALFSRGSPLTAGYAMTYNFCTHEGQCARVIETWGHLSDLKLAHELLHSVLWQVAQPLNYEDLVGSGAQRFLSSKEFRDLMREKF